MKTILAQRKENDDDSSLNDRARIKFIQIRPFFWPECTLSRLFHDGTKSEKQTKNINDNINIDNNNHNNKIRTLAGESVSAVLARCSCLRWVLL